MSLPNILGGGKSLLPLLCAKLHPNDLVIVVCPLIILKENLLDRARQAGIERAKAWDKEDIAKVVQYNVYPVKGLLFVTTDLATSGPFQTFLNAQDTQHGTLVRLFIDEVHLCLEAYREVMSDLYVLRSEKRGWVLLTATLSPQREPIVFQVLGAKPLVLRPDTSFGIGTQRLNIEYAVRNLIIRCLSAFVCLFFNTNVYSLILHAI